MPSVEPLSDGWFPSTPDFPFIRLEDYYGALTGQQDTPWEIFLKDPKRIRSILQKIPSPAVILHEHVFRLNQGYRYRIGLWLSYTFENGIFHHLNHEKTFHEGIETYIRIYRQLRWIPDGIFLLADMEYAQIEHLFQQARLKGAFFKFQDRFGDQHRFFRLPESVWDRFSVHPTLVLADGHHRMAASEHLYREGQVVQRPVVLVSLRDPGLVILPTHRLFEGPLEERALRELSTWFEVDRMEVPAFEVPKRECWILSHQGIWRIRQKRDLPHRELMTDKPDVYVRLETAVLHEVILPVLERVSGKSIDWVDLGRDPRRLWNSLKEEQFIVVLPPTLPQEVFQVAKAGLTMPPKSTDFYPKLVAGVIWTPLASSD